MVSIRVLFAPPLSSYSNSQANNNDLFIELDSTTNDGLVDPTKMDDEIIKFQLYSVIDVPPEFISFRFFSSHSHSHENNHNHDGNDPNESDAGVNNLLQDGDHIVVRISLPWKSICTRIFSLPDQALNQPSVTVVDSSSNTRRFICVGCAETCHLPSHIKYNDPESILKKISDGTNNHNSFICECGDSCLFQDRFCTEVIPKYYFDTIMSHANATMAIDALNQSKNHINENQMIQRIKSYSRQVAQYEDPQNQKKAQSLIPHERLWNAISTSENDDAHNNLTFSNKNTSNYPQSIQSYSSEDERKLLKELLEWYKNDFFTWVNAPPCHFCGSKTSNIGMETAKSQDEIINGASRVEVYKCDVCDTMTRFPRYNSSSRLLDEDARRGRCGEWANVFTLIVRSMGYPARLIMDWTDHVWTEVWLTHEKRWCHMDSCEASLDNPLMYESGWNKKLNYIIAFSADDGMTDVIWRYTRQWKDVCTRRTKVSEEFLDCILQYFSASIRQKPMPLIRAQLEDLELKNWKDGLMEKGLQDGESHGRQSGDKEWRRARGELGNNTTKE